MDEGGWITSRAPNPQTAKHQATAQQSSNTGKAAVSRGRAPPTSKGKARSSSRRRSDSSSDSASESGTSDSDSDDESDCSEAERTRVLPSSRRGDSDSDSDSARRRPTRASAAASRSTRSSSRQSSGPKTRFDMASAVEELDDGEASDGHGDDSGGWMGRGAPAAAASSAEAGSSGTAAAAAAAAGAAGAGGKGGTSTSAAVSGTASAAAGKKLSASAARDRKIDAFAADVVAFCRAARRNIDAAIVSGSAIVGGKKKQVARVTAAPRSLTGHLHPHQLAGLNWLLALWATNIMGVLADDMGLGKTIQVIALLAQLREFQLEDAQAPYTKALAGHARTGEAALAWPASSAPAAAASTASSSSGAGAGAGAGSSSTAASDFIHLGGGRSSSSSSSGAGALPAAAAPPLLVQLPNPEALHSLGDEDIFALLDQTLQARKAAIVQASAASATDLESLIAAADATTARARGKGGNSDSDDDSDEDSDDDSDDDDSDDSDDDDDLGGYSSRAAADAAKAAAASAAALNATPHGRLATAVRAEADGHILALQARGSGGPHLIIVPTSTAENWGRELAKWCPALTVLPFTGGEAARKADAHRIGSTAVTITTYSLIERPDVQRALKKVRWAVLVLDEAHSLKNAASKRFAAVGELKARMRLLLTGTPVQNNLRELTTLLRLGLADLFMGVTGSSTSSSGGSSTSNAKFRYEAGDDSFSLATGGGGGDDDGSGGGKRGGGGGGAGGDDDGLSPEERAQMMLVEALERAYAREMKAAQAAAAAAARAAKAAAKQQRGGGSAGAGAGAVASSAEGGIATDSADAGAASAATAADGTSSAGESAAAAGGGGGGLGDLFAALVLRRTKDAVLSELPPKTRRVEWAGMTPAQQAAADTIHSLVMALDPAGASLLCQATITALTASPPASESALATSSTGAATASSSNSGSGFSGSKQAAADGSGAKGKQTAVTGPVFVAQLAYCVGAPPPPAELGASSLSSGAADSSESSTAIVPAAGGKAAPGRRLTAMERELAALKDGLTPREAIGNGAGAGAGAGKKGAKSAAASSTALAIASASGAGGGSGASLSRVIMLMRKVANHPLLLRLRYSDAAVLHTARLLHQLRAYEQALAAAAAPAGGARGGKAAAAAAAARAAAEAQLSKRRRIAAEFEDDSAGAGAGSSSSSSSGGGVSLSGAELEALLPAGVHPLPLSLDTGSSAATASARSGSAAVADAAAWAVLPASALREHTALAATGSGSGSADAAGAASPALHSAGVGAGAGAAAGSVADSDVSPASKALAVLPPGALPSFHRIAALGHARPDEEALLQWADGDEGFAYEAQALLDASDFDIDCAIGDALAHASSLPYPGITRSPARAALQRLRLPRDAFLDCGKARLLESLLASLASKGSRALLFSQFTGVLDILEAMLDALGHKHVRIDGSVAAASRQSIVDTFAEDESILVFLLSTRAGGVGLNLTAADTVILYDSDWNPTNDSQAEDRAYRIGQTKPVTVYRLLTPGTIEVHMADVTGGKWAMAQKLMSMSER